MAGLRQVKNQGMTSAISRTNHAKVAEAYGVRSWTVDDPLKLEAAIKAAIECGEPALVDIISQPLQDAAAPVSQWMG